MVLQGVVAKLRLRCGVLAINVTLTSTMAGHAFRLVGAETGGKQAGNAVHGQSGHKNSREEFS